MTAEDCLIEQARRIIRDATERPEVARLLGRMASALEAAQERQERQRQRYGEAIDKAIATLIDVAPPKPEPSKPDEPRSRSGEQDRSS